MTWRPGLRARLTLGALALAALAVAGAGLAVYGLARTQALAAEALAAQRRIEAYGALSSRVNEWMLGWLTPDGPPPDATRIMAALAALDRLVAEDATLARAPTEAAERVRRSVTPARIRAEAERLERSLAEAARRDPAREAATYAAAQIPALTAAQVQQEVRRRDAAMAAMDALRRRLHRLALAVGIAAPLVLAGIYRWVLGPLFARLAAATASAEALAAGAGAPGPAGHDELGLLLARLRRVAQRVARERARLEATVGERTAALSHANARLARADAERRRFFADVGHELRTPLTVILGEAELGARRHPDAELRASFGTIRGRALRLMRRIEDLLRVARSESGQLELERGPVDLVEVVRAALADAAPLLARAGVAARAEAIPPLVVTGDADWLRQVFVGFLENAAKYAGRGAAVTIGGWADAGTAEVAVADTGPGLPPEARAAPFDRFSRGAEAGPGFGVGLALAAWVVEAHGGSLRAEAPETGGLRLVVRLPLAETETV